MQLNYNRHFIRENQKSLFMKGRSSLYVQKPIIKGRISHSCLVFCTLFFSLTIISSCKKLVQIQAPINTITSTQVFNSDATAILAINGIYEHMVVIGKGASTIYSGLSADEINGFGTVPNLTNDQSNFQFNTIQSNSGLVSSTYWNPHYTNIYAANAIIEGLQVSTGVSDAVERQLMGEAKFLRAFCYFYLVNFFGDVPLVTSTSWGANRLMTRTSVTEVYAQIISDLKDAQTLLNDGYVKSDNYNSVYPTTLAERVRANKAAASALLARVYLFSGDNGDYSKAEEQASLVMSYAALYDTVAVDKVFLANSKETIWQLQPSSTRSPFTTFLGNQFLTPNRTSSPKYFLTPQLIASFETGDKRRVFWVDSTKVSNTIYYYPAKYRQRQGTSGIMPTEYYMVLRLAEQFLIRAEARAKQNNLSGAISDLNVIRKRAGLPNYSGSTDQTSILNAIYHERQIELFVEWGGYRWLDLKRTGQASAVLAPLKPSWQSTAILYPIPLSELQKDPNLVQNPGYNP